jgi:cysteine desulfurase family protein (TIGR01976 family)
MAFDIHSVRSRFPALAEGLAHLDGPGGTQMPLGVIDAVSGAMRSAVSNRHGPFRSSARADKLVDDARSAVADLLGGVPEGVVIGPNMTTITFALARALQRTWTPGDEIVVSRLDHDANIRPWVLAAADAGVTVRWAEVDVTSGELPVEQYADLVGARTRLVAVTAASNALGTMPDVRAIADIAHAAGALVHVDGVAATPHVPVDVAALGADFYACSSYKFFGPHLGATIADPALWAELRPYKLAPSPDEVPDRFETGTIQLELLPGLTAAVEHLAFLGDAPPAATRRERVLAGMGAVMAYESELLADLLAGLAQVPGVRLLGTPARRVPTVAFTVAGQTPLEVAARLGGLGVCVWPGHYYAGELMAALGLADGGAVRVGVVHYNDVTDVARLIDALAG